MPFWKIIVDPDSCLDGNMNMPKTTTGLGVWHEHEHERSDRSLVTAREDDGWWVGARVGTDGGASAWLGWVGSGPRAAVVR